MWLLTYLTHLELGLGYLFWEEETNHKHQTSVPILQRQQNNNYYHTTETGVIKQQIIILLQPYNILFIISTKPKKNSFNYLTRHINSAINLFMSRLNGRRYQHLLKSEWYGYLICRRERTTFYFHSSGQTYIVPSAVGSLDSYRYFSDIPHPPEYNPVWMPWTKRQCMDFNPKWGCTCLYTIYVYQI